MNSIRTCVGCRQQDSLGRLIKVVRNENRFLVDQEHKLFGRGAWFHLECGELVLNRRGLQRSLGDASTAEFETWLRNQAEKNG